MIRNLKTIDPRDKSSTPVIQLETAMGAAIECFAGATAIEVPRSRFAPVKTTSDLLALRSDAYEVRDDGQVTLRSERHGIPPVITLSDEYKQVDGLNALGTPSLLNCHSLEVRGPAHFADGAVLKGTVRVHNPGTTPLTIHPGVHEDETIHP